MDSGPQENWTGLVRRGNKKVSSTLTQGSSHLSQPRPRVLRGQRQDTMEEGESSRAESDSSDQGGVDNTESRVIKCTIATQHGSVVSIPNHILFCTRFQCFPLGLIIYSIYTWECVVLGDQ